MLNEMSHIFSFGLLVIVPSIKSFFFILGKTSGLSLFSLTFSLPLSSSLIPCLSVCLLSVYVSTLVGVDNAPISTKIISNGCNKWQLGSDRDDSVLQTALFILLTHSLMYRSWERDLKEHLKNLRLLLRKSVPRESMRFLVFTAQAGPGLSELHVPL